MKQSLVSLLAAIFAVEPLAFSTNAKTPPNSNGLQLLMPQKCLRPPTKLLQERLLGE